MKKALRTTREYKDGKTLSKKQPIYLVGITSMGMHSMTILVPFTSFNGLL